MSESTSIVLPFRRVSREDLIVQHVELAERFGRHVVHGLIDGAKPVSYIEHCARLAFHHARRVLDFVPVIDNLPVYLEQVRTTHLAQRTLQQAFGERRH